MRLLFHFNHCYEGVQSILSYSLLLKLRIA